MGCNYEEYEVSVGNRWSEYLRCGGNERAGNRVSVYWTIKKMKIVDKC